MHTNTSNLLPKSLQEDNLLVNQLKSHLNYVCDQMSKTKNRMDVLDKDTSDFHIQIQNIQNKVCDLKHKRYVQELIIDENGDRPFRQQQNEIRPPNINSDSELRESIVKATSEGLEMISQMFKPIAIQIPNQVLNTNLIPNNIYEAIDSHLVRDLPPIIGSLGFNSWNATEVADRPVETNEITIGNVDVPAKSQIQVQQVPEIKSSTHSTVPVIEEFSPSAIPIPPPPIPIQQTKVVEKVDPKQDNDLLKQLSERLAKKDGKLTNIENELPTEVKRVDQIDFSPEKSPMNEKTPTPLASQKNLIESSDEELFEKKPLESKPISEKLFPKEVSTKKPIKEVPVKKPVKQVPKKSLMDDESDDSFDELFKQSKPFASIKPKPIVEVSKEVKETESIKVTTVEITQKPVPIQKLKSKSATKRSESKKRSLFDSTSSEDEEDLPLSESKVEDSSDEDMPKSVLNSVSNDFSSRLNQALLKRPSPTPSSSNSIKVPEKTPEKPISTPIPSTIPSPKKRDPIENKKQESVAALRDKLGGSITKAHTGNRLSTENLDIKKASLNESSDEGDSRKITKIDDSNTLIQTLKARPRPPGRNTQRKPPIPQSVVEDIKKETLIEDKKLDEKKSIVSSQKSPTESKVAEKPLPKEVVKKPVSNQEPKVSQKSESKEIVKKPVSSQEPKEVVKKPMTSQKLESKEVIKKPVSSQPTTKTAKSRKGLFDSDSDDPF